MRRMAMTLTINSITITKVSLYLLMETVRSANIIAAVIPALRKITVDVADDDVSGESAVFVQCCEIANF